MRIACYLFGCECDDAPFCRRCGEELYEGNFCQTGKLDWLWTLKRWIRRRVTGSKCEVCGKRFWRGEFCCSEECFKHWVPF